MRVQAIVVLVGGLACGSAARAVQIQPGDFGPATLVESFEGLVPGANLVQTPGTGFLSPGVSSAFPFPSGVTLTSPIPNPLANGVRVGDFSLGVADFGLGIGGQVTSGTVPHGSAFVALDETALIGPVEFTFPSDVSRVGAVVDGAPGAGRPSGVLTLSVYDVAGNLLESATVGTVPVAGWSANFLGISHQGIRRVTFEGNFLVLDDLRFERVALEVPTLSVVGLVALALALALAAFAAFRRQRLSGTPGRH